MTCPEEIKSPPGMFPATMWRLEAFQPAQNGFNVELTLLSGGPVWASVMIKVLVKGNPRDYVRPTYVNRSLDVTPYTYRPETVQRSNKESFKGFVPFTSINFNPYKTYFDGDDFNIQCAIFINKLDDPNHAKNVPRPVVEVKGLKAPPQFELLQLMEDARHKGRYTDVTIVSADKEFKAHKVVLATQSAFFEIGLEERWKKDGAHRVEMLDVPADTMDTILMYMYTGKVMNIDKSALDLLPKADEYQLEGLKFMCEEALSKTLTAQTVIDVLLLADTHNAQNLKQSY